MTVATIKEKLHDYISEADDEKVKALYILLEDQMTPQLEWWEDEKFVAELDKRQQDLENGTDRGYSIDEVKAYLDEQRKSRIAIR